MVQVWPLWEVQEQLHSLLPAAPADGFTTLNVVRDSAACRCVWPPFCSARFLQDRAVGIASQHSASSNVLLSCPTGEGRISRVIGWHGGTATPCNGSDSIALPAVKMTCGSQGKQRPASSACSMHRDDNKRVPAAYMIAIDLQVCCTMETAGVLHVCRASGAVSMYESQAGRDQLSSSK
jgi:hypothetical protein